MKRPSGRSVCATFSICFLCTLAACGGGGGSAVSPGSSANPEALVIALATSQGTPSITRQLDEPLPPTAPAEMTTIVPVAIPATPANPATPAIPPPVVPLPVVPLPPTVFNTIQRENAKTAQQGVTDQWQIPYSLTAFQHEIEGYASATSVNRGGAIQLFVNTVDPQYTINIYRIGWYGGAGARLVAGPIQRIGERQPTPVSDPDTRMVECNWTDPYVLSVPLNQVDPIDWASGVYLAKLTGSSGKQSYIVFVVRDDARHSDILFQTAVTTYGAYNSWGGYSLYGFNSVGPQASKVSLNRPYSDDGSGLFLRWEINMLRFIEREGYDTSYSTDIDTHDAPAQLLNHRAFLSVGHDEYWTKSMRDGVEAARDKGVNLAFFGANAAYWQIRLETSPLTKDPDRTIVGYKQNVQLDPLYKTNPTLATYRWREPVTPPINRPEATLIGVMFDVDSDQVDSDMIISNCLDWVCAETKLSPGSTLKGMLGYEVDILDKSSPAGIVELARSAYRQCLDATCATSEIRHSSMTYYTAPSGAGVFATGSMNWNFGVDNYGWNPERLNPAVQQITRNILTRFVGR
ncbi:MAG: hypothetical protein JWR22_1711 [Herminiimonas sp.]|nr:hypothetical protein [Herminiimonas sp.]